MLEMWFEGFLVAISGANLLYLLVGTFFGLIVGALPGLGANFALALALPMTFWMEPASAIILMCALHASATYGGSIASILINAPGTVGSVATCWDGHPLAQQGKARLALSIAAASSFAGGLIGWIMIIVITPFLVALALKMGPPEYFMIALIALSLLSLAAQGQTVKGLILGGLGVLISFVGRDPMTGMPRYTFGSLYLEDGIPLIAVAVGLFALSQAFIMAEKGGTIAETYEMKGSMLEGFLYVIKRPLAIARAAIVGILMGIIPALGVSTANIVSYFIEKKASKDPEQFGKGHPSGVLAPEASNNGCIVGELVPTLTLGIPGASPQALLLAALIMHGIQPGPDYFEKGALPYAVFIGVLLAQFAFFIVGTSLAKYFAMVCKIPNAILVSMVTILCFIGAYAWRHTLIDVGIMIVFALFGYILIRYKWPHACFILGFVLGKLVESNFHRSLLMSETYSTFFTRPGSLGMIIFLGLMFFWPLISKTAVRFIRMNGK